MRKEINVLIGLRIRDARMQRGFSLEELARQAGMSASHLSNVEHGIKALSIELLLNISETLGVSMDYIMTGRVWTSWGTGDTLIFKSDEELLPFVAGDAADSMNDSEGWNNV